MIIKLINKYRSNCSRIAKEINGRTGNNIKNRFKWSIKRNLDYEIDIKKITILFHFNIYIDDSIKKNGKSKSL